MIVTTSAIPCRTEGRSTRRASSTSQPLSRTDLDLARIRDVSERFQIFHFSFFIYFMFKILHPMLWSNRNIVRFTRVCINLFVSLSVFVHSCKV